MVKILLLVAALIPSTFLCGAEKIINVSGFNRIVFNGKAIVHIQQSDKESLKVSGSKNSVDGVAASVKYGELAINHVKRGWFGGFFQSEEPPNYHLTVKDLESIVLKGSGEIFGDGPIKSDELKLVIEGAGLVCLDLKVKEVKTSIFGAGKVILKGTAESQIVEIEGRGDYEGKDLVSRRGRLTINGSGDAEINATEELTVTINGNGNVIYYGKPKVNKQISGHGNVINK
jgi:Putative auto-transporter adhesin, head GIN domain